MYARKRVSRRENETTQKKITHNFYLWFTVGWFCNIVDEGAKNMLYVFKILPAVNINDFCQKKVQYLLICPYIERNMKNKKIDAVYSMDFCSHKRVINSLLAATWTNKKMGAILEAKHILMEGSICFKALQFKCRHLNLFITLTLLSRTFDLINTHVCHLLTMDVWWPPDLISSFDGLWYMREYKTFLCLHEHIITSHWC